MSATDLLWVHTNGGTVTIRLKDPNDKLFHVGSSGTSPLTGSQRRNPVTSLVIEFAIPKDGIPGKDLIVVETLSDGNRVSHLLELTWRDDGSSRIELGHTWVNIPGRTIQSFATKSGGTGLSVLVDGVVCSTVNNDGSDGVDADTICQYAAGRISGLPIPQGANKATGSADTGSRNIAAEQLTEFLVEAISIALEPMRFFRRGRIRRIRELWARLTDVNQDIQAFRKYLRKYLR